MAVTTVREALEGPGGGMNDQVPCTQHATEVQTQASLGTLGKLIGLDIVDELIGNRSMWAF